MNGGNLYDLQKILGHADIKTTQRYAHLSPNHLKEAVNIVNINYGSSTQIAPRYTFVEERSNLLALVNTDTASINLINSD